MHRGLKMSQLTRSEVNSWRVLHGQEMQKPVAEIIAYMKTYVDTYMGQAGVEDYDDDMIIDDIVYMLGMALDSDKYSFRGGFDEFKARLVEKYKEDVAAYHSWENRKQERKEHE
jgi:hypothetical protein